MPTHDWTLVEVRFFHDFHLAWTGEIRSTLNKGILPTNIFAKIEPSPLGIRGGGVAIRHVSEQRLIALIEIVSPSNKDRPEHVVAFVDKAVNAIYAGVHVMIVDLFPPGLHDGTGLCNLIAQRLGSYEGIEDIHEGTQATVASFVADDFQDMYVERLAIGVTFPDMPLFLEPQRYVNAPLERTYLNAYEGTAEFCREILEGRVPGDH